jgi:hypothetical protein
MSINYSPIVLYIYGNKVPGNNVVVDKKEAELDGKMGFLLRGLAYLSEKH